MRHLVYALAFTFVGTIGAHATGLEPIQAQSLDLGSVQGVTYYTVEQDGLRVVTTVLAGEAALRFVSTLGQDQNVVLSVPGLEGSDETRIVIERQGDRIYVNGSALAMK